MASGIKNREVTSTPAKVTTTKPGAFGSTRKVDNFYTSKVTTNADGSMKRETFRTDAQGNDPVKIAQVDVSADGVKGSEVFSDATAEEKKDLQNPDSQLAKSVSNQTKDANKKIIAEEEAAAGNAKTADVAAGGSGNDAENDNDSSVTKPASTDWWNTRCLCRWN